jgi:hypothetical protein
MSAGMKSVARHGGGVGELERLGGQQATKLCAMAAFGSVPFETSLLRSLPAAGIVVTLYFMSSPVTRLSGGGRGLGDRRRARVSRRAREQDYNRERYKKHAEDSSKKCLRLF